MRLLFLLCAITAGGLASCAPQRIGSVPSIPKAKPVDVNPVRESLTRASAQVGKARESTAKVDGQIEKADQSAKEGEALADRLFAEGTEPGGELAARLRSKTTEISSALAGARATMAELTTALAASSAELETSKNDLATVQGQIAAKDIETATLREQNSFYGEALAVKGKEADKQRTRADTLAGEIRLYSLALGIVGILVVIWIVLKFFLPPRFL